MTETAADRLSRLLALVPWLVARDGVTISECADHFGVSPEQLEHDLWLLVVCGVPGYGPDQLVDIQFWEGDVIHVLEPQTLKRPLRLSQEEALSLLVALRMLAQVPGVENRDAVISAAVKLEEAAHADDSDREVSIDVRVDPRTRAVIDDALEAHREVAIRYVAATTDEVTDRTIRPRRLFAVDGVIYLEAYCTSAEALRTFRLDRVMSAELGAVLESGGSADDEPADGVIPSIPPRTAVLALDASSRWILDAHHAETVDVTDLGGLRVPDGRTAIRLPLHSVEWAARLVLSQRGGAIALAPAELVTAVARATGAALAAYSGPVA